MRLDAELHGDGAASLIEAFLASRGTPLAVDASQVRYVDTPCVEIFISAAKLWRKDGVSLSFGELPEPFALALSLLGLSQSDLESKEALT